MQIYVKALLWIQDKVLLLTCCGLLVMIRFAFAFACAASCCDATMAASEIPTRSANVLFFKVLLLPREYLCA
jgi:hypothetical protein